MHEKKMNRLLIFFGEFIFVMNVKDDYMTYIRVIKFATPFIVLYSCRVRSIGTTLISRQQCSGYVYSIRVHLCLWNSCSAMQFAI